MAIYRLYSDYLYIWADLSKNRHENGLRMSHNKYYTRFNHRRGKQEVIIGAGVSPISIRNSKKHLSYHHHIITPIYHQYNLMFHYSFTTVFLFGMKNVILRSKNRMKNVNQLHHLRSKWCRWAAEWWRWKILREQKRPIGSISKEGKVYLSAAK